MRWRERKASWLIMIDSFRALSSPPSLPLSLWLDYGDVFPLSSPPHPILLSLSLHFFLHISVAFPCACLFIHPLEKEAVNLAPAPPCLLTHIPSSLPTFIHLSPIHHCLSFSPLSSLFSLALSSHSFSLERFRKMHLRSFFLFSFFLQSLPLFILVLLSPLLHSFFDLSFPLKQSNGKNSKNANLHTLFLSADLSWRSSRVDPPSDTRAPCA